MPDHHTHTQSGNLDEASLDISHGVHSAHAPFSAALSTRMCLESDRNLMLSRISFPTPTCCNISFFLKAILFFNLQFSQGV